MITPRLDVLTARAAMEAYRRVRSSVVQLVATAILVAAVAVMWDNPVLAVPVLGLLGVAGWIANGADIGPGMGRRLAHQLDEAERAAAPDAQIATPGEADR